MRVVMTVSLSLLYLILSAHASHGMDVFFSKDGIRSDRYIRVTRDRDPSGEPLVYFEDCSIDDREFKSCENLGRYYEEPLRQKQICLHFEGNGLKIQGFGIGTILGILGAAGGAIGGGLIANAPGMWIGGTTLGGAGAKIGHGLYRRGAWMAGLAVPISDAVTFDRDFATTMSREEFRRKLAEATSTSACSPPVASVTSREVPTSAPVRYETDPRLRRDSARVLRDGQLLAWPFGATNLIGR